MLTGNVENIKSTNNRYLVLLLLPSLYVLKVLYSIDAWSREVCTWCWFFFRNLSTCETGFVKLICNQLLICIILTCKTDFYKGSFAEKEHIPRKNFSDDNVACAFPPIISFNINLIIYGIFDEDLTQDLSARVMMS